MGEIRDSLKDPPYRFVISGILVLCAVGTFVFADGFFKRNADERTAAAARALDRGLERETAYLLKQARELNEEGVFDRYVASGDIAQLLSAAIAERDRRGLGGLLITNSQGLVLTRSRAVQQRGDFVYHTTVWGRELADGREVAVVEEGAAHPLDVLGAVPMERNGKHFGSIVAAYIVDDAYAERFKQQHLSDGAEVAFHMPGKGIVGHSFENGEYGRTLSFYFNEGTDLLRSTSTIRRVAFNGDEYFVRNVFLSGINDSPGDVLVFVPAQMKLEVFTFSAAALAAFLGLALLIGPYLFRRHPRLSVVVFVIGTAGVFGAAFVLYDNRLERDTVQLTRPTYAIYNSTMELDPPVAAFNRQFEHRVGIRIFSGGESINAVEARLSYDPMMVRVADIDFSRSFCDPNLLIERSIDNETGEVAVVCGLPNPGFSERTGIVADLALQPLQEGTVTLSFDEQTRVLANDGLGTQVLRYATDGSYVVTEEIMSSDGTTSNKPLLFSPTHANPERWYHTEMVSFTWTTRSDASYRYVLTDEPSVPSFADAPQTADGAVTVDAPRNGTYYFHLMRENGEDTDTAHHKVKIDTEPPTAPRIRVNTNEPRTGEIVRFEFSSEDRLSGLQNNFYIKFNDGIFLPTGEEFSAAFFEPGEHTVTVRVFDTANNFSESSVTLRVRTQLGAALHEAFR